MKQAFKYFFISLGVFFTLFFLAIILIAVFASKQIEQVSLKPYAPFSSHLVELQINGPILEEEPWLGFLRDIESNTHCKGLLIRVNSPGGAVGSSQELYREIKKISKKIPVAVSMGNIAASGGYYLSLGASKIFANEGTLTGSIGVVMQFPQVKGLMDKWGIGLETITSGEYKASGDPFKNITDKERSYFESLLTSVHWQFREAVHQERKLEMEKVLPITEGQVYTGKRAKELGLVDTLGTGEDARRYIQQKVKNGTDLKWVVLPPEKEWFEKIIESRTGSSFATKLEKSPALSPGAYFLLPGSLIF